MMVLEDVKKVISISVYDSKEKKDKFIEFVGWEFAVDGISFFMTFHHRGVDIFHTETGVCVYEENDRDEYGVMLLSMSRLSREGLARVLDGTISKGLKVQGVDNFLTKCREMEKEDEKRLSKRPAIRLYNEEVEANAERD